MKHQGCIHLYHGEGKGKTTCAMGLALRSSFYGKQICILQCLKDGSSGEVKQLATLPNVTVLAGKVTEHFSWQMTEQEKIDTKIMLEQLFQQAQRTEWDMLLLDEVCGGLSTGLLSETIVKDLIHKKPPHQELILTGRNPPPFLLEVADYCSYFQEVKHPYETGLQAREGIEY